MLIIPPPPITTLFPYTTLFRSPEVRVTGRPAQNPQREEGERLSLDVRGLEVRPAGGAQGLGERVPQLPDAQRSLPLAIVQEQARSKTVVHPDRGGPRQG